MLELNFQSFVPSSILPNRRTKLVFASLLVAAVGCGDDSTPKQLVDDDDSVVTPAADAASPTTIVVGDDAAAPEADAEVAPELDGGLANEPDAALDDAGVDLDATADAAQPPVDLGICHVPGNETFVFGDSYIALSGDFTRLLQTKARAAMALGARETYVDRAVSGAMMAGLRGIPSQYTRGAYKLAIGCGGGNDILIGNAACLSKRSVAEVAADASCVKTVSDALTAAKGMFERMGADGVKAVVYFFYPHLPGGGLLGGPRPNFVMDYSYPLAKKACEEATGIKCFFVDTRKAFDDGTWTGMDDGSGKPRSGLIGLDSVHPTTAGSQLIADQVWSVMQSNCLGSM